jgi:hypothetical protein
MKNAFYILGIVHFSSATDRYYNPPVASDTSNICPSDQTLFPQIIGDTEGDFTVTCLGLSSTIVLGGYVNVASTEIFGETGLSPSGADYPVALRWTDADRPVY